MTNKAVDYWAIEEERIHRVQALNIPGSSSEAEAELTRCIDLLKAAYEVNKSGTNDYMRGWLRCIEILEGNHGQA